MLQREHSAILSTFSKLPFSIKTFVLSIFKWSLKTGFIVHSQMREQRTIVVNGWKELTNENFGIKCRNSGAQESYQGLH